jgi:hypothetical protein
MQNQLRGFDEYALGGTGAGLPIANAALPACTVNAPTAGPQGFGCGDG